MIVSAIAALPASAQEADSDNAQGVTQEVSGNIQGVAEERQGDESLMDPNLYVGIQEAYQYSNQLRTDEPDPSGIKTIFFTLWQYKLLQEAKSIFRTRRPDASELTQDGLTDASQRPWDIRELSLGGILFRSVDSWIVWLNGQRVTPEAIPKQVIDIRVQESFIELKWFDSYTNLIYPVRIYPHQRFNLDSRIFLPGVPAQ